MKKSYISIFLVFCVAVLVSSESSSYPTISVNTLKKVFDSVKPYSDLSNAFYSVKGLELLGEAVPAQSHAELCNFFKSKVDKNSIESVYYATSLSASLQNCVLPTAEFQAAVTAASSATSLPDLYYYTLVSTKLNQPIDSKKVAKSIVDGLKSDSSIINQAYSLHIATLLPEEDAKTFFDSIEDILEQADEIDKKYLQYEGGVGTTSLVLEGILALSEKFKQLPAKFDQVRLTKFVNYLTSKRYPTNIKSAYFLLRGSLKLSDNKFRVPLVLNRLSPVGLSASQPNILVSITNILGQAVKQAQFNVDADSVKSQRANGPALLSAKKRFNSKSSEGTLFELRLIEANQKVEADFYVARISATPAQADNRFFLVNQQFELKVATQVSLTDIQVGVADRDQSAPKYQKVDEKTAAKLDADQQSKFFLKFTAAKPMQQTFVRFVQVKSGRDIVFLAQSSSNGVYTAEIDFTSNAKNFRHASDAYTVELIVSDSLVENPQIIKLADLKLQFVEDQASGPSQDKNKLYSALPEIKHTFRLPEKTPPASVSTVFTALCVLPLLILFVLWVKIGFNFSKFSFSLSGIAFHTALASVFGLFFCYWLKLNMFQTVRYLVLIGGFAVFAGQSLLKSLAESKTKKD